MIAYLAARGIGLRVVLMLAGVLSALLVAGVWLHNRDARITANYEAKVDNHVQRTGRAADRSMLERMINREGSSRAAREEFDNAANALPAERLTRRQRLDLCIELRDAGTDTTVIPQCRDLHPGAPADTIGGHPPRR